MKRRLSYIQSCLFEMQQHALLAWTFFTNDAPQAVVQAVENRIDQLLMLNMNDITVEHAEELIVLAEKSFDYIRETKNNDCRAAAAHVLSAAYELLDELLLDV